ncbi:MAG TPA: class I tRNA ligase family protein, partial [Kofleriaceae bacterium]
DGFEPSPVPDFAAASPLDRALWSETEQLRVDVERAMEALDFAGAYAALEELVTTLSTWYVRLAKPALWRDGLDASKRATYDALYGALVQLALVAAPFVPFLAESVYAALGGARSVHLEDWPAPRPGAHDATAVSEMRQLRALVRLGRFVREQAGVKHRQPLRVARVAGLSAAVVERHRELLASELNVKAVELLDVTAQRDVVLDYAKLGKRLRTQVKHVAAAVAAREYREDADGSLEVAGVRLAADEYTWRTQATSERGFSARDGLAVALDLSVDEALLREATARELARAVQDLRKRARLRYGEHVRLSVVGDSRELDGLLDVHGSWLAEQCAATLSREPVADPTAVAVVELGTGSATLALARSA